MSDFSVWTAILIGLGSLVIYIFCARNEELGTKVLFGFLILTTYIYSGMGIAYESVSSSYITSYFLFLVALCLTIKLVNHTNLTHGHNTAPQLGANENQFDFDYNHPAIFWLAITFMITNGMHLIVPSFNIMKLFTPGLPTSELIYARRAAADSNVILRFCSTINIFCLPFFCIYLKKLADKNKKGLAIFLVLFWAYLDYLQYDYLSRYQMLIFVGFAYSIGAFIYPGGIHIKRKYVVLAVASLLLLMPFLNAYIQIRNGTSYEFLSIGKAVESLIESETYYPQNYDTCLSLYGSESILNFLLWLICLPIPSVIFPSKPTVTIAYKFTYALSGLQYGAQAYYSSSLPSILGESMILWGQWLVGFQGIILGIFIGSYFKFIRRYPSLSVLQVYMLLMVFTLGRGGASSYMSTLINGTFSMLIWGIFSKKTKGETHKIKEIMNHD